MPFCSPDLPLLQAKHQLRHHGYGYGWRHPCANKLVYLHLGERCTLAPGGVHALVWQMGQR